MSSFLCAIPFLASLFSGCGGGDPLAVGYVEGEYVLVAPIEAARIISIPIRRGEHVEPGVTLAQLETRDAEIAVAKAQAALAQSESHLADLSQGRRPEEIAAIEATLASAKAKVEEAERVLRRRSELLGQGIATKASFESARTELELAHTKVAEAKANLAAARLPARKHEIDAAEAAVAQARAVLEREFWQLSKRTISVPVAGVVTDIVRHPGEIAGPQAPVLTVLPDGAVKLKFYVPEPALSSISLGTVLEVHCDGCEEDASATISYISDAPEFTPPVIYSLKTRQKLVYLVEARPQAGAEALKPGQIVDVELEGVSQ